MFEGNMHVVVRCAQCHKYQLIYARIRRVSVGLKDH